MEERNISEDKEFMERLDKAVDMQMSGECNDNDSFDLIDYVYNAIKDYYIGTEADSSQEPQTSPCFGDKDFGDDFYEMIKQDICLELLYKRMTKPLDKCSEPEDGKPYQEITVLQKEYDPMLLEYPALPFYVDIYGKLSDKTIKTIPNMYRSNHKFHSLKNLKTLDTYLHSKSNDFLDSSSYKDLEKIVNECYLERTYCFFIKERLFNFYYNRFKKIFKDKTEPYNISVNLGEDGIISFDENNETNNVTLKIIDETIYTSKFDAIDTLINGFVEKKTYPFYTNITDNELDRMLPYLPDELHKLFWYVIKCKKSEKEFKKAKYKYYVPPKGYPRFIVRLIDYIANYATNAIISKGYNDKRIIFDNIDIILTNMQKYQKILFKLSKLDLSDTNSEDFTDEEKKFIYSFATTDIATHSKKTSNITENFSEYLDVFDNAIEQCQRTVNDPNVPIPQNINNYIRIFTKAVTDSLNYYLNEIKTQKSLLQHSKIQTIQNLNRYFNSYNTYSESFEFAQQCASYEFVITRSYFFKKYMEEKYPIRFIRNVNYIKNVELMMATVNRIYTCTLNAIEKYAEEYKLSIDEEYLKEYSYNHISIIVNPKYGIGDIKYVPAHIQNLIIYDITTKPRPYFIPFFSKDHSEPTAILGTPLGTPVPETL